MLLLVADQKSRRVVAFSNDTSRGCCNSGECFCENTDRQAALGMFSFNSPSTTINSFEDDIDHGVHRFDSPRDIHGAQDIITGAFSLVTSLDRSPDVCGSIKQVVNGPSSMESTVDPVRSCTGEHKSCKEYCCAEHDGAYSKQLNSSKGNKAL